MYGATHQYAGDGATGHIHGLRSLKAMLLSFYLRSFCVFRVTYLRLLTGVFTSIQRRKAFGVLFVKIISTRGVFGVLMNNFGCQDECFALCPLLSICLRGQGDAPPMARQTFHSHQPIPHDFMCFMTA